MSISMQEAVKKAKEWAEDVFQEPLVDLKLEEVVPSEEDEQCLKITLGWQRQPHTSSAAEVIAMYRPNRVYKVFSVNLEAGEVTAVRIREFQDVGIGH